MSHQSISQTLVNGLISFYIFTQASFCALTFQETLNLLAMIIRSLDEEDAKHLVTPDVDILLKIVLPSAILLGIARLITYYLVFNLKILNYIDVGEILTSFLDHL